MKTEIKNTTEEQERSAIITKVTTPASLPVMVLGRDALVTHEAEIITPHPYGVFALCKIMEHFQIN